MAELARGETRTRRRFDVWNEVPLVPQLTGMSCWAAAAAMIVGWRERMAADPRQVARGAGSWQAYAGGLRPSDVQTLARAWGLVEERRETWTPDALRRILQRHGPVWLGEASPGLHSIVVTGMHGDGTPDGTWVRINDPWPVGRGERYTLPWRTLSANYRAASDLIGVQAHVLHAGGRRGSSHTRVEESRVTRSRITLPPLPGAEEPMIKNGNGRRLHAEEYGSAYGSPLSQAASALPAGEMYVNTSAAGGGTDPLRAHGGTGENLYLTWTDLPDGVAWVDVVVHLHGYKAMEPNAALTRAKVAESGLRLDGRRRPTLGLVPRGKKVTPAEVKAGKRADRYTFDALFQGDGAGLEALVNWALAWLGREALRRGSAAPPALGRLILTAHSGGGEALERLLGSRARRRACNPEEVHVFDALYGASPNLEAWARERIAADQALVAGAPADPDGILLARGGGCRILYGGGTRPHSLEVARAFPRAGDPLHPAYRAEATSVGHPDIPSTYQPRLLELVSADVDLSPGRPAARGHSADPDAYDSYPADDPAAEPAYGYVGGPAYGLVGALAVDDDVRAWLAATAPTDRAPLAASVRAWIADTARSGIELIGDAAKRRHFLGEVDWTRVDFPGNDADRSAESNALFNAVAAAVPERRVTGLRFHDVDSVVQTVPGEPRFKLHPEAKDAFVRMRDAAHADGVELRIGSAYRSLARQREIAASNPNPNAVAQRVSAHSYGLAVDLLASVPGLRVGEISTRPFTNIVALYRTPMYKWMALHAREHGFFPYRREPWHWEYNPAGFAERWEREAPPAAHAHTYGAPLGLFERYPQGALDAAPAPRNRIAVPRVVDVRDRAATALQAPAQPAQPAAVDWCAMRQTIAGTAIAEERRWTRADGSKLVESNASQLAILEDYWKAVPGFSSQAAAHARAVESSQDKVGAEWSAAFICYVMKTAGVTAAHGFGFGGAHIHYIVAALRNRERSDTAKPFWLVDSIEILAEATPQPGDLLCFNRKPRGEAMTNHSYSSLRRDFWDSGHQNVTPSGKSHCALVVRTGRDERGNFVETIGGNEEQSVRVRRVQCCANGGIADPEARHIFGMIRMTGCNR